MSAARQSVKDHHRVGSWPSAMLFAATRSRFTAGMGSGVSTAASMARCGRTGSTSRGITCSREAIPTVTMSSTLSPPAASATKPATEPRSRSMARQPRRSSLSRERRSPRSVGTIGASGTRTCRRCERVARAHVDEHLVGPVASGVAGENSLRLSSAKLTHLAEEEIKQVQLLDCGPTHAADSG